MIHPIGALITELRTANIASGRVRGGEPAPGDAKAAGSFQRFVVLTSLGHTRAHRAPYAIYRIGVRAYAPTFQDAAALYGEISDALDNAGPRLSAAGLPIYQSLDDTGSGASKDPDTNQPYEEGVLEIHAGTAVLPN